MDCAVSWWVNLLELQSQQSDPSYSTLSKVECLLVCCSGEQEVQSSAMRPGCDPIRSAGNPCN